MREICSERVHRVRLAQSKNPIGCLSVWVTQCILTVHYGSQARTLATLCALSSGLWNEFVFRAMLPPLVSWAGNYAPLLHYCSLCCCCRHWYLGQATTHPCFTTALSAVAAFIVAAVSCPVVISRSLFAVPSVFASCAATASLIDLVALRCERPTSTTPGRSTPSRITCTCSYDEVKGIQDQDFSCSFSDSPSPLRFSSSTPRC